VKATRNDANGAGVFLPLESGLERALPLHRKFLKTLGGNAFWCIFWVYYVDC